MSDPAIWKIMWEIAQQASPLVSVISWVVTVVLWRQHKFERAEHRKAENNFTQASTKVAVAMEKLAGAINGGRRRSRSGSQ